jgi:N-acetyl-gamma-glutamyl-phosphate reductase
VDSSLTTDDARDVMRAAYAGEPFVVVRDGALSTKATQGSNTAHVSVVVDPRTGWLIACGALDNLVKGAAGQAVQNMNLMFGLPETAGLTAAPVLP